MKLHRVPDSLDSMGAHYDWSSFNPAAFVPFQITLLLIGNVKPCIRAACYSEQRVLRAGLGKVWSLL
jgi:hypothetical protein